ncbi:type II secretion system F family protein [Benzoatithermus flavus]|uniref:Type II secretion system F family protein n=1 Tax=Benzoatithermus flavus TaxID=3108223 RepID=A0ABU8XY60_9PROT
MSGSGTYPHWDSLLIWLVGALTFASVMSVWHTLLETKPGIARTRAVARRRLELGTDRVSPSKRRKPQRHVGLLRGLMRHLRWLQKAQIEKVNNKLIRAGIRSRESIIIYIAAKFIIPILIASLYFIFAHANKLTITSISYYAMLFPAGLLVGFFMPDLYIMNRTVRRNQMLEKALPDGLDLLVVCAEAGLSLDAALSRVAEEMVQSSPELADELAIASIELSFLPERKLALFNLGRRVGISAMIAVVNTLIQTEKYGTPLAQSLRVISAELRERRMLRAEEKAARLPAILTVPMILFILPSLFVVLVGPAIIDVYDRIIR